jgi:hypothetical protein
LEFRQPGTPSPVLTYTNVLKQDTQKWQWNWQENQAKHGTQKPNLKMQELISKKIVDKFVWDMACNKETRFTASYISKNTNIDIDFVKKRLLELTADDKLFVNFDIICESHDEFKVIDTYQKIDKIPIGKILKCTDCGKEIKVTKEHIWVTFSPNTNYFDDDMCNIYQFHKK